jgi:hypothetical protein
MSTPGKEGEERGFNELRIEDKKGEEEIYVHAEKDVNIYVKNDWKEHILNEKHETVDKLRYTQLKDEDHLIVHKDSHAEYKTKWLAKTGEAIHFKSGQKIVLCAGDELTLKVGGSFIKLTSGEVTIVGDMVKINSGGSSGIGTARAVVEPHSPQTANLSQETINLINQSPTLVDQINNNAVSIEYGPHGGGTYLQGNRIVIDSNHASNPQASVQLIAHEMGHVTGPNADVTNTDTYTHSRLSSEGAATLNNMRVRQEILSSGGSDIGIAGNAENHGQYTSIYNDYNAGKISQQEAQQRMGNIFGTNEMPSTNPDINYDTYYRNQARVLGIPEASHE